MKNNYLLQNYFLCQHKKITCAKENFLANRNIGDDAYDLWITKRGTPKVIRQQTVLDLKDFNKAIKKDLIWIDIKKGEFLLFNQNLPHGNITNKKQETRWSMNCRFKSIFSPYKEKQIGEFFEPITLKPASIDGMNYKLPKI